MILIRNRGAVVASLGMALGFLGAVMPLFLALPVNASAGMLLSGYLISMASVLLFFGRTVIGSWALVVIGLALGLAPFVPLSDPSYPVNLVKTVAGGTAVLLGLYEILRGGAVRRLRSKAHSALLSARKELARAVPG